MRSIHEHLNLGLREIERRVGPAFAEQLRQRVEAASTAYDEPVALQHLRNLVLACAFEQGPQDLREVLERSGARAPIRLRPVVQSFDAALIEHFEDAVTARLEPEPTARRCLLVIAEVTRNSTGPHMRQVCAYATVLAMRPTIEAVRVLITQELGPEGPRVTDGAVDAGRIAELDAEARFLGTSETAAKIEFVVVARNELVWPCMAAFDAALAFRPDVLLAFQGIFQSRALPPVLARYVPTIAVQSNANNPEPDYCDLVLAQGHHTDFSDKPHPDKWRDHPIPVLPLPKTSLMDVAELGPPNRVRIATALGNGRLDRLLMADDGILLDRIIAFLQLHREAVWLLIGLADPSRLASEIAARSPDLTDRLRPLPRMPDLRAIYEHCRIYMHLPGEAGGGMAAAMAVAEGLAVVVPNYADAANFIPTDTLYKSEVQGFQRLVVLLKNERFCADIAARQRDYMEHHNSYKHASETLAELLPLSFEAFQRRQGSAV